MVQTRASQRSANTTDATDAAGKVIQWALAQRGKPYRFGAAGPDAFDCSGLVMQAFRHGAGIILPHFTGAMISYGTPITRSQLQPADIIFPNPHHVQLYIGNGQVCEAPDWNIPVRVVNIWGFWQARRIIGGKVSGGALGIFHTPKPVQSIAPMDMTSLTAVTAESIEIRFSRSGRRICWAARSDASVGT
jgi:cell wall-associated NlpC family hydrolase